jgi:hypothetical protein
VILVIEGTTWKVENKIELNLERQRMGESELEPSGSVQKQVAGPYEHGNEPDMVQTTTNIGKRLRVPCITNAVCLPPVSATLLAIFREMHYKEYIKIV